MLCNKNSDPFWGIILDHFLKPGLINNKHGKDYYGRLLEKDYGILNFYSSSGSKLQLSLI